MPRIVVTGTAYDARHFNPTVAPSPETALDGALADAVVPTIKEINRYIAILFALEKAVVDGVQLTQARILIDEWLSNPGQEEEEKAAAIFGRKHLLRPTSKLISLTDGRPIRECRSEHTGRN